jgi:hypothetical protein
MTLHLFVDAQKELLIHAFTGDEKEAERFKKHRQSQYATHIRVEKGNVTIVE